MELSRDITRRAKVYMFKNLQCGLSSSSLCKTAMKSEVLYLESEKERRNYPNWSEQIEMDNPVVASVGAFAVTVAAKGR